MLKKIALMTLFLYYLFGSWHAQANQPITQVLGRKYTDMIRLHAQSEQLFLPTQLSPEFQLNKIEFNDYLHESNDPRLSLRQLQMSFLKSTKYSIQLKNKNDQTPSNEIVKVTQRISYSTQLKKYNSKTSYESACAKRSESMQHLSTPSLNFVICFKRAFISAKLYHPITRFVNLSGLSTEQRASSDRVSVGLKAYNFQAWGRYLDGRDSGVAISGVMTDIKEIRTLLSNIKAVQY